MNTSTRTCRETLDAANRIGRWMRHSDEPLPEGMVDWLLALWLEEVDTA